VSEAAEVLRVTRQRVYQLIGAGALVAMKVRRTVLVSVRSVEGRVALLLAERR
jgi:excisionase family DNA binding protein